jgi:hypothetical protein
MRTISENDVERALPKVAPGLEKYRQIQGRLHSCDVSADRDFQRRFDHFYRVRKGEKWRACFFRLMQTAKHDGISFPYALDHLQRETGSIEASFTSKLVATIDPAKPVIDKFVLGHFELALPYPKAKERFNRVLIIYEALCDHYARLFASPTGSMILNCFDRHSGETDLTPVKKADLVLWQIRH